MDTQKRQERSRKRFWERVDQNGPVIREDLGPCWVWTRGKIPEGYGEFWMDGTNHLVHRISWLWSGRELPADRTMHLDHLCRNRACVRPEHLELVTRKENISRGIGITALNEQKTHCIRGHEFTEENTYRPKNPHYGRQCRMCIRLRSGQRAERK